MVGGDRRVGCGRGRSTRCGESFESVLRPFSQLFVHPPTSASISLITLTVARDQRSRLGQRSRMGRRGRRKTRWRVRRRYSTLAALRSRSASISCGDILLGRDVTSVVGKGRESCCAWCSGRGRSPRSLAMSQYRAGLCGVCGGASHAAVHLKEACRVVGSTEVALAALRMSWGES